MREVLVNCLGGLSLPRKSVVRLTDRPDMTLDVYRGRKTTKQTRYARKSFFCRNIYNRFLKSYPSYILLEEKKNIIPPIGYLEKRS